MRFSKKDVDWSLYAIVDKEIAAGRSLVKLTKDVIAGGAGVIQLRNKIEPPIDFYHDALSVCEVTKSAGVPLIINDRVDIAMAVNADGVHLGQEDLPVAMARKLLGEQKLIGLSVHSVVEFQNSATEYADYLGVGTMFPSSTKKDLDVSGIEFLRTLRSMTGLPLVAIGGITLHHLDKIFRAGADGAAVISDLFAVDDVKSRAQQFTTAVSQLKTKQTEKVNSD